MDESVIQLQTFLLIWGVPSSTRYNWLGTTQVNVLTVLLLKPFLESFIGESCINLKWYLWVWIDVNAFDMTDLYTTWSTWFIEKLAFKNKKKCPLPTLSNSMSLAHKRLKEILWTVLYCAVNDWVMVTVSVRKGSLKMCNDGLWMNWPFTRNQLMMKSAFTKTGDTTFQAAFHYITNK